MKKVIITGGTGMLGIALTKYLIEKGIQVTLIINPSSQRKNVIPVSSQIKVIESDIKNLSQIYDQLEMEYDAFFHFAWMGTFGAARNDMHIQTDNIKYTIEAVELADRIKCKAFIGAGSQAEYGRISGRISPDTAVNPENGYGMAKLCAGQMSRIVCQKLRVKHIWMRVLSTYGPYDGKHTMVMSGLMQLLKNGSASFTKGEQMWDYLYCDDAAEAFYLAAKKGKNGSVYCLGSGQTRPLSEYIEIMRDTINPTLEIRFGEIPYNENQVMYLCADITQLTEDTGFIPKTTFQSGINTTLKWLEGENR